MVLGQNPPEIAYWERGQWWLCGEDRPWQPEAVTVASNRARIQTPPGSGAYATIWRRGWTPDRQSPTGRNMLARNSFNHGSAARSISVSGFGRRPRFAAVTIAGLRSSLVGACGFGALACCEDGRGPRSPSLAARLPLPGRALVAAGRRADADRHCRYRRAAQVATRERKTDAGRTRNIWTFLCSVWCLSPALSRTWGPRRLSH